MKRPSKAETHLAQKLATLQLALKEYTDYSAEIAARCGKQNNVDAACRCSACTGCPAPSTPSVEELALPEDDPDGVKCDRCGRYVWNDNGNERLRCPTTCEWLCSLCSNVECPYPTEREEGREE